MIGFKPASEQAQRALEAKFDAQLNANDLRAWMERMSSAPNHLGSAHDKANADFILAKFKEAGWDARIETFYVAYPTPKTVSVEMVAPTSHKATLTEGPVPGDRTSTTSDTGPTTRSPSSPSSCAPPYPSPSFPRPG